MYQYFQTAYNFKVIIGNTRIEKVHDDVIKWKHFPRYWSIVRGLNRSPVNSPPQRPVTRSFDVFFDLRLKKTLEAGDLRRHRGHYDVKVMLI